MNPYNLLSADVPVESSRGLILPHLRLRDMFAAVNLASMTGSVIPAKQGVRVAKGQ